MTNMNIVKPYINYKKKFTIIYYYKVLDNKNIFKNVLSVSAIKEHQKVKKTSSVFFLHIIVYVGLTLYNDKIN